MKSALANITGSLARKLRESARSQWLIVAAVTCCAAFIWFGSLYFLGERIAVALTVIAAIGLFVLLLVARSPESALTMLTVSLPLVAFGVVEAGWSIRPTQMVVMGILTVWVVGARVDLRRLSLRGWLLAYVISLAISVAWTLWQPATNGDRFDPYFWFVIALAFVVVSVRAQERRY
jgi:hypothetical protein